MANDTDGLLTAQNARIQNLEAGLITQGQGLLALEQTQQQILQQLQTLNTGLTLKIPDDFQIVPFIPASYEQIEAAHYITKPSLGGYCLNHKRHLHILLVTKPKPTTGNLSFSPTNALEAFQFLCNYQIKIKISWVLVMSLDNTTVTKENLITISQNCAPIFYVTTRDDPSIEGAETYSRQAECFLRNISLNTTTSSSATVKVLETSGLTFFETNNLKNTKTYYIIRGNIYNDNKNPTDPLITSNLSSSILYNKARFSAFQAWVEIMYVGEKLHEKDSSYMQLNSGDYDLTKRMIIP